VGDEPTFVLGTEVRVNYAHHVLLIYNASAEFFGNTIACLAGHVL
jgi:hypothetical protein